MPQMPHVPGLKFRSSPYDAIKPSRPEFSSGVRLSISLSKYTLRLKIDFDVMPSASAENWQMPQMPQMPKKTEKLASAAFAAFASL